MEASNKKLARFTRDIKVGIWENLTETVTIYEDRTVVKSYTVKWKNNSGSLKPTNQRATGSDHNRFLNALKNAEADEVEPDDYVFDALFEFQRG